MKRTSLRLKSSTATWYSGAKLLLTDLFVYHTNSFDVNSSDYSLLSVFMFVITDSVSILFFVNYI